MTAALLDPAFARELEALARSLRPKARSGGTGSRTGSRRGGGSEFEEHGPYAPGDDVGRVDWAAFARTGQPFMKRHRADDDAIVRILVDASRSLAFGEPSKLDTATRVAASAAYLALAASERAQLMVLGGHCGSTFSDDGRCGTLGAVLRNLSGLSPRGAVNLGESVRRAVATSGRPGMLVVISDFLDDGPFLTELERAAFNGHDVALVQILAAEELDPRLEGDMWLEDAETGATLAVTADASTLEAYRARLSASIEALRRFSRSRGAVYVRAASNELLAGILRRFVARGID